MSLIATELLKLFVLKNKREMLHFSFVLAKSLKLFNGFMFNQKVM